MVIGARHHPKFPCAPTGSLSGLLRQRHCAQEADSQALSGLLIQGRMRKEWKWPIFSVIAVSLLTTGLLVVLFVPRLGWVGLHEYREGYCHCCGGTGVLNP